jgi:hypothetical protein
MAQSDLTNCLLIMYATRLGDGLDPGPASKRWRVRLGLRLARSYAD